MNRLLALLCVVCLLLSTNTIEAQTLLGYSNGTAARKNGHRFGSAATQGMAIYITKEKAQLLKGAKIVGIQSAFGTSQVQNLKLFITKTLHEEPFFEQDATGASTSWKSFSFDTPYVMDGEAFYIGYTFEVGTTYKPLLFDESKDMAEGCSWVYQDGEWVDVSNKGLGVANIRMIAEDVPSSTDIIIKPVHVSGYYKQGQRYSFSGQLFNFGTETIRSFVLECSIGDAEPIVYKVDDVQLKTGSTYDFTLPEIEASFTGKLPFTISVNSINGGEDADTSDNLSHTEAFFYPSDVEKKILVETFTGQTCGNCPAGHVALEKAIQGMQDEFVIVSHHAGYNPDVFTTEEDVQYTWLYNSSSLYAPACTFNRMPYEDGLSSVVFITSDTRNLNAAIAKTRNLPPYVGIELGNNFDEQIRRGELNVKVHTYELPSHRPHRLNVFLIQDNIEGYQSGAGSNYNHTHVFRDALSATWGDEIELNEGTSVSKQYAYQIPDAIESTYYSASGQQAQYVDAVLENLKLVVFVSDVSDNALECFVYNAAEIEVTKQVNVGIDATEALQNSYKLRLCGNKLYADGVFRRVSLYQTAGNCVVDTDDMSHGIALSPGVYVVRGITASGEVISDKILVK